MARSGQSGRIRNPSRRASSTARPTRRVPRAARPQSTASLVLRRSRRSCADHSSAAFLHIPAADGSTADTHGETEGLRSRSAPGRPVGAVAERRQRSRRNLQPRWYAIVDPPTTSAVPNPTVDAAKEEGVPPSRHPSFLGAAGGIRTPDPQVRSLMLYPTELRPLGEWDGYYRNGARQCPAGPEGTTSSSASRTARPRERRSATARSRS